MSNFNYSNALIQLVDSLTKSEKRYFKLYSHRNSTKEKGFRFIELFDVIDKKKSINQAVVLKVLPNISSKQLSDLKRHLYNQLIDCLRLYNANNEDFKINSKIEIARVLYSKGLFHDSLYILKKAKQIALTKQKSLLVYQIIDFEKEIESRHITRSHALRVQELENETNKIRKIIRSEANWSEFSLKLYDKFIKNGHVKTEDELVEVSIYFKLQKPPQRAESALLFFESLYRYQAFQWYNFIIQNFTTGYKYSKKWVDLFELFPQFKQSHPLLFIKGLHNCLSVLYNCMDINRHKHYLYELELFTKEDLKFDSNTRLMTFVYLNNARLNNIILTGEFSQNQLYLADFEKELSDLEYKIDDYRSMVFWYRLASIHFTIGDYGKCIRLLNLIINPNQKSLREDLQCFARLLNIIAHFELGNDELLNYVIKSTYRFLLAMNEITKFHRILIKFIKQALFKDRRKLKKSFSQLKLEFEIIYQDPYERRSLLYLDIISWLESKIENISVEHIIYNKRQLATTKPKLH